MIRTFPARWIVACLPLLALGCAPSRQGRQKVGGPNYNISGMALVGADSAAKGQPAELLVVHDNKKAGEPHVGSVVVSNATRISYRRLPWPQGVEAPVDLESICPLPQAPGDFLALTSAGRLLHLRYNRRALEVLHESTLPDLHKRANVEGVAVQTLGGKQVAIWADRGEGDHPATLYWGTYDPAADAVTPIGKHHVTAPYPADKNTRHVTDLRLDGGGVVWAAAASDPGDKGPFESAVYSPGTIQVNGDAVTFQPNPSPTRLWTAHRKIEAIEFVPGARGRVFFGADDEDAGGWLYVGRD